MQPDPQFNDTHRRHDLASVVEHVLRHLREWLAIALLAGWMLGVSVWSLLHPSKLGELIENDLERADRHHLVAAAFAGVAATLIGYWTVYRVHRARGYGGSATTVLSGVSRYAFMLIGAPLLTFLVAPLESKHEILTLFFIGILGVLAGVLAYRAGDGRSLQAAEGPLWRCSSFWWLIGAAALYGAGMSYLAVVDHRNLGTHAYDLGIYDNIFWNTLHGKPLGCSLCKGGTHTGGHFDPILVLFTPIYAVFPRAETILTVQSLWLAQGGIPIYLAARRTLQNGWAALAIALLYYLHPALHGANLFDFHSLTLVIPLLLWCVYFIDVDRPRAYWPILGLVLFTREDMPLLACFIGAYAILRRKPVLGLTTIAVSLAYLFIVKRFVMAHPALLMPGGSSNDSHIYYYEDMIPFRDEGARGLVVSMLSNPAFALRMIFLNELKVFYFVALLLPLAFLPLLAGRKAILFGYALLFIGMVSRKHVYSLHFQYSSVIFPFLMMSVPDALAKLLERPTILGQAIERGRLLRAVLTPALCASVLMSAKFGALLDNTSFKGGWNHINRLPGVQVRERYGGVRDMVALIPEGASVAATSTLAPHVSNRADVFLWPRGIGNADYLLLRTEGLKEKDKRKLKQARKKYELIAEYEDIQLLELTAVPAPETRKRAKSTP